MSKINRKFYLETDRSASYLTANRKNNASEPDDGPFQGSQSGSAHTVSANRNKIRIWPNLVATLPTL